MKYYYIFMVILLSIIATAAPLPGRLISAEPVVYAPEKGNMFLNHDTAAIVANNQDIIIQNFEAKSGEAVSLDIKSDEIIDTICFSFPVSTKKVSIQSISGKEDLKSYERVYDTAICYEGIVLSDTLSYRPIYNGKDTIKYNISYRDTVIDPYIVGSLSSDYQLGLYIPFNNNSQATFSSKLLSLNSSATRNTTYSSTSYSYSGTFTNPTYYYDGNYGTSAYTYQTGCSASTAEIYLYYNRTANDTGMIIQKRDDILSGDTPTGTGYTNLSIPSDCFTYNTAYVTLKVLMSSSYYAHASINYYCLDNTGYTLIWTTAGSGSSGSCSSSSAAYLYETTAYITNQSGYTAYNNTLPQTAFVNTLNLTAGYLFNVKQNSQDITGSYNGVDTGISYNSSGANFNGTGSRINLSNTLALGDLNQSFSFYVGKYRFYNQTGSSTGHLIGSTASGWQKGWQIQISPTATSILCTNTSGVGGFYSPYAMSNMIGEHSLAGIIDTQPTYKNIKLYVDGVLRVNSNTSLCDDLWDAGISVTIGMDRYGSNPYNGTIKNVQLFNRSLTATEVLELNNSGTFANNILGESNSALNFTGNQRIYAENFSFPAAPYTWSFWAKYKNNTGIGDIIRGSSSIIFRIVDSNSVTYYNYDGSFKTISKTINTTDWNHYTFTCSNGSMSLYVNSVLAGNNTATYCANFTDINFIGGDSTASTGYNGQMDELMIFSRALNQEEITTLYNGFNSSLNISIYDEQSGSPISSSITMTITGTNYKLTQSTITSNIFINSLTPGNYNLLFSSGSYTPRSYNITIPSYSNQQLPVYLAVNTTSTTTFTTLDYNSGAILPGVHITQQSYNNGWQTIESKDTDISGKAQFSYLPNTQYQFLLTYTGYLDYSFELNPVLYSTYDIRLTRTAIINFSRDYAGMQITFTPNLINGTANVFSMLFYMPSGSYTAYGFTLTYPGGTLTKSGTTATGSNLSDTITVSSTAMNDTATLNYYYNTPLSGLRNFTATIPIESRIGFMTNKDNTYGLGIFERVLITTLILLFVMGAAALVGQIIPGLVLTLFTAGYITYIGFLPLWLVLPSMFIAVLYLIWKGGGY